MTDLEAVNRALTLLGVSPVGSLSDETQAARVMSSLTEATKNAVLSDFAWPFALRLRTLVASPATPPPGWSHAWLYPSGAACLYQVYESLRLSKVDFIVALDGAGTQIICTNEGAVSVEYTERVTLLPLWRGQAVEAYVCRLASDAAVALTGSPELAAALFQKYGAMLALARAAAVTEEHVPHARASHYIDVR